MNSSTVEVKDYSSTDDSIFDDEFHSKVSLGLSLRMKQIDNVGGQTCGYKSTNKDRYHVLERSASTCHAESKNKDNCIADTVKSPSINTPSVMDSAFVDLTEIFENEEINNQLYSTTNTKVEPSHDDQSYNKIQAKVEPSGDDKIVNSIKKTPGESGVTTVNDRTFKLSELLEKEKITDQLYNEIQVLPCDGSIATSQDSLIEDVLQDAPICQEIQNESECDHQQCDNDLISDLQKCVDQACNSLYKL